MLLSTSTNICAFLPDGRRNPLETCIDMCARRGYQLLDINFCEGMNPGSLMRTDAWEAFVARLKKAGDAAGVRFNQSHLPYYDVFASQDPDYRTTMERLIRRSIIASGMLGVPWAVTHPCTVYEAGPDMSVSLQRNLDYYGPHVALARQHGLGIALENEFEYKARPWQRIFGSAPAELAALIDAFGDPAHVGACYDFGHGNLTGGHHRQNLAILGSRLRATHVNDNRGTADEHLMPFFGTTDWRDAMHSLRDIGYAGELTYEIQEFGRYLPNDLKHLVIDQSLAIGRVLTGYFEEATAPPPENAKEDIS